jgi:hypothetical protein
MKHLILNDDVSVYIGKVLNYNKNILLKQFQKNFEFSSGTKTNETLFSGKQSILMIYSKEINDLKKQCIDFIETISVNEVGACYIDNWIYVNDKNTSDIFFHNHIQNKQIPFLKNEWVYTFYLQMPDNLKNDEGYLLFKTTDGVIHKILPEEGDVIIFPAHLLHTPTLAPNSTRERVVLGGVYSKLDLNKSYNKSNKTIF